MGQIGDANTRPENTTSEVQEGFGLERDEVVPFGYFIINRAEVDFHLELVDSSLHSGSRKHLRLAVSKIDVEQDDVMTCFKRLDPTSPWWAIHPSTIQNPDFSGAFLTASVIDATENGENEDTWIDSVQHKFRLPSPLFYESLSSFVIKKHFTCKFTYDHESQGYSTEGVALLEKEELIKVFVDI